MKRISEFFVGICCLFIFYGMIYFALFKMVELPVVYESYSTNNCRHIFDKGIKVPCDKKPEKYHLVYVE